MESTETTTNYSVGNLYKSSWELVKKHWKPLAMVTLLGVAVNIAVSSLMVFVVINNLTDDISSGIASGMIAGAVSIFAGVFVGLLQIIALKRAKDGKELQTGEIVSESLKFVPLALGYGLFVVGILVAGAILIGIASAAIGALGLLLGLAFIVGIIIAIFRYAFLQFLVVEPKEMSFMERFTTSQKLTDGIYGTLFTVWLLALVLSIGGAIVSSVLSSPFSQENTANINASYDFRNAESVQEFREDVKNQVEDNFDVNYLITQIISQAISWGVGLVVIGALLELYNKRKHALHM